MAEAWCRVSSSEADFVTGQAMVVDGGLTLQLHDDFAGQMTTYASDAAKL